MSHSNFGPTCHARTKSGSNTRFRMLPRPPPLFLNRNGAKVHVRSEALIDRVEVKDPSPLSCRSRAVKLRTARPGRCREGGKRPPSVAGTCQHRQMVRVLPARRRGVCEEEPGCEASLTDHQLESDGSGLGAMRTPPPVRGVVGELLVGFVDAWPAATMKCCG